MLTNNLLSPTYGLIALLLYFMSLVALSFYRARSATLSDYYIGSHNSTWWLITLGMISDSVSGVTFVSVPGSVFSQEYSYFQVVLGYFLGYMVITNILLPLYYKKNLISIYSYLGERFGPYAQKTASVLFISSRTFGSAARLYISVMILHECLLASLGMSPILSFTLSMGMIVLYTYKGGIKSLVWTEAYQSIILLASISFLVWALWHQIPNAMDVILKPTIFFTDPIKPNFFLKSILGGMLITSSMNGLDQNIMQMNLSCKSLSEAKKNMFTLAFVMVAVNFVFMALGSLTKEYYALNSIALPTLPEGGTAFDQTLPKVALEMLGKVPAMMFIIGLAAATFSSAGTILPAIASSIEIDLFPKKLQNKIPVRVVHTLAAVLILALIIVIYKAQARSLIDLVLRCSGYTYGPLIGLFGIGIFSKFPLNHKRVPLFCALSITFTAILDLNSARLFNGYKLGVELIAINAMLFLFFALSFGRRTFLKANVK
jgi:Na+/proline symporter